MLPQRQLSLCTNGLAADTIDRLLFRLHTTNMIEAMDDVPPEYIGEAWIKARPNPELSLALERFINPARIRSLGGRALELRSEQSLSVYRSADNEFSELRRSTISMLELAAASTRLIGRKNGIKPKVSPEVAIRPLLPKVPNIAEGSGIDLRFKLVIDAMTRQVLEHTSLIDDEGKIPVHFRLRRPDMLLGMGLNDARDKLLDLVQAHPQTTEAIYISSPDVRH